jgi:hypothetical protein
MAKPIEIERADEVRQIAEELVAECHPHLADARILYVFTSQKRTSQGKLVLGKATKFSPMQKFLSSGLESVEDGFDFVITIYKDGWEDMSDATRRALVDHELCHCRRDGDKEDGEPNWSIQAHDVEEFRVIVERHGMWHSELKEFATALKQLPLL